MKSKRSTIVLLTGLALGVGLGIALNLGGVGRFGLLSDARAEGAVKAASPVEPVSHRDVYYPGSETLGPDEMRVIACGTGMPTARPKQAASCWLLELGNGDKFIFDIGTGSAERLSAMKIPYDYLDKVFIGHLHVDHYGDLPTFWLGGTTVSKLPHSVCVLPLAVTSRTPQ